MRVILTCFQNGDSFGPLLRRKSVTMLPVLNKPLLQHHIEQSVKRGQKEIHIVVVDYLSEVEMFVGDGSRWGIEPQVWFFRQPCRGGDVLHRFLEKQDGPFLLIPIENLIDWDFEEILSLHESQSSGMSRVLSKRGLYVGQADRPTILEQGLLMDTGILITDAQFDPQAPLTDIECDCRWIRIDDPRKLWAANLAALRNEFPGLSVSGTKVQEDVWVGHHTVISSSAGVEGPTFVGNHVHIGPGATLLGDSVVGDGTIIDQDASVSASVVLPNTYVGTELYITDSIVTGRFLMVMSIGVWASISDRFLLTDIRDPVSLPAIRHLLDRVYALLLAVATFPIWFVKGLARVMKRKTFFSEEHRGWFRVHEAIPLEDMRRSVRFTLRKPLPIYDTAKPEEELLVRDISEQGVCVEGVLTRVNNVKTFMVDAKEFAPVGPIAFSARCRWIRRRPSGENLAGFEIIEISPASMAEIRRLIDSINVQDSSSDSLCEPCASDVLHPPGRAK